VSFLLAPPQVVVGTHISGEDAIQFNAQRFQLPDQVATFQAMPIYVDRSIVMTPGVMKVSLTRYGSLNVIMCINHAEVQSFTTKTSERMDMRPKGPLAL
jgi:lipoprotein-anchoring transpeptidase ErfK/SrfK